MKKFKEFFAAEVAEPRGEDEKRFKDKHIVAKRNHPSAEEDQFTSKKKKAKREADLTDGKDKEVYEEMSADQENKKEEIVKSMKKKSGEFKERYGDKWKSVMYATATKQAMKEAYAEVSADSPKVNPDPFAYVDSAYTSNQMPVGMEICVQTWNKDKYKKTNTTISYHNFDTEALLKREKNAETALFNDIMKQVNSALKGVNRITVNQKYTMTRARAMKELESVVMRDIESLMQGYPVERPIREEMISYLESIVEDNEDAEITLPNEEEAITVTVEDAKAILGVYEKLSDDNKIKMADALVNTTESYTKMLTFAIENYEE